MGEPRLLIAATTGVTLEAFLLPLARTLRGQGWRVDGAANGVSASPACRDAFDEVIDLPWTRRPLDTANLRAARVLRQAAEDRGYDIVHVHTPVAALVGRFTLRKLRAEGLKVVYTAHGFHFYPGQPRPEYTVYRWLERHAARWTDRLVVINAEDYRSAVALGTIPEAHVVRMPGIGVDCGAYSPEAVDAGERERVRRELGAGDADTLVVCIAEFNPGKRHRYLLDALALTRAEGLVLVLVGTGPLEDALKEQARDLHLEDRVRFAGYRTDVAAVLAACEASVLLSEREGLPRSVLESLAMARPVVGTDIRGIRELVDDEDGWLVPQDDAAAVARALDAVVEDRETAVRKGEAGRRRACERYSQEAVLAMHRRLYDGLLTARL